jgi:hypothetical protein
VVDADGQVVASSDAAAPAPVWSAPTTTHDDQALLSVSCPSSALCAALQTDGSVVESVNPFATLPHWRKTSSVAGFTEPGGSQAVGDYGRASIVCPAQTHDPRAAHPTWTYSIVRGFDFGGDDDPGSEPFAGLNCLNAHVCVGFDGEAGVSVTRNASARVPDWSRPARIRLKGDITGMSCAPGGLCAAIDSTGHVATAEVPGLHVVGARIQPARSPRQDAAAQA